MLYIKIIFFYLEFYCFLKQFTYVKMINQNLVSVIWIVLTINGMSGTSLSNLKIINLFNF
jgi:hypothetical protein